MPVGDGVGDALEDAGGGLDELHGGERRAQDEVFGQRENDAVRLGLDAGEGAGGLGEEGEGLAALAAGELAGEVEERPRPSPADWTWARRAGPFSR